jgi:hypothetical protein
VSFWDQILVKFREIAISTVSLAELHFGVNVMLAGTGRRYRPQAIIIRGETQ